MLLQRFSSQFWAAPEKNGEPIGHHVHPGAYCDSHVSTFFCHDWGERERGKDEGHRADASVHTYTTNHSVNLITILMEI